jgi:hypothetical protein
MFAAMQRDDNGDMADPYDDAKVIQRCVRDNDGKTIFEMKDLPRLATIGNDIMLGLVAECLAINGIGTGGRAEIEKNLKALGSDS